MNIPENRHLGRLCKREHNWNNTGKSLRNKKNECIECYKIKNKEYQSNYNAYYKCRNYEYQKKYQTKCRKNNNKYKLNSNIASSICMSLKGSKNGQHWEDLIGYTVDELKRHLEKQFRDGMNWSNYGRNGWHIDHIIPISVFNFSLPEHIDFKRCWALENLRPLWGKDNIRKKNKLDKSFQPSLAL